MPVNTGFQRFRQADQDWNPSIHYYLKQTESQAQVKQDKTTVIPGVFSKALLMKTTLKVLNIFKNMGKVTMCISHIVNKLSNLKRSLICLNKYTQAYVHMNTCYTTINLITIPS